MQQQDSGHHHLKAAEHLERAAYYHREAARLFQAGDLEQMSQQAFAAEGHVHSARDHAGKAAHVVPHRV